MENIYNNGTYLKNNPNWHLDESEWKAKKVLDAINKHNLKLKSICEVGCGYGQILKILSEQCGSDINYYGYDISPQAFEVCSKKTKENLKFFNKDFLKEDVYYDLVLGLDLIEHIEDYFGFLKILKRKGKHKLFHFPLALSVQSILRPKTIIGDWNSVGHIHCFTKELVLKSLEYTGYKILDYSYIGKRVEVDKHYWKNKLIKIPRKLLFKINQDFAVRLLGGYSISVLTE